MTFSREKDKYVPKDILEYFADGHRIAVWQDMDKDWSASVSSPQGRSAIHPGFKAKKQAMDWAEGLTKEWMRKEKAR